MNTIELAKIIQPTVVAMGYQLWGCEYFPQGKYSVLRLYIDKADGITVDDCQAVTKQVAAVLGVENAIRGKYSLEVSSPGIDRILFTPEQYRAYIGQPAKIRLVEPMEGHRTIMGSIKQVEKDSITIEGEEQEYIIPLNNIKKAKLSRQL